MHARIALCVCRVRWNEIDLDRLADLAAERDEKKAFPPPVFILAETLASTEWQRW